MTTLICNCNETMPLNAQALAQALLPAPRPSASLGQMSSLPPAPEPAIRPNLSRHSLSSHTLLCRRQAPEFQKALIEAAKRNDPLETIVVACTQEQRLFADLSVHTQGAEQLSAPIKFVNIRETGGWSKDAAKAMPKIAALLAAAHLPDPEPVSTVTYKSAGRLLVVGAMEAAQAAAQALAGQLEVTIFALGTAAHGPQQRDVPVLTGQIQSLKGWLGAFKLHWQVQNPIDLDACTRCNTCITACPEGAIGLDYQIDLSRCQSHRACVKACDAAGAIDFGRPAVSHTQDFDLVLDVSASPLLDQHALPQGYFTRADIPTLLQLQQMVGEFEKPKFFQYKSKICAHSRNTQIGCKACVDVCSAKAISSDVPKQQIVVNPHLCVGCGACTTVCPTGALSYSYPRIPDQGSKIKTLLSTYAQAGGKNAVLLLHSQGAGQQGLEALGRAAGLKRAHGVPHNVIPVGLWHTASTGLDLWLSALCWGAEQVAVWVSDEEAPDYRKALQNQIDVAQALLEGLGWQGQRLHLLEGNQPLAELDQALVRLGAGHSASGQVLSALHLPPARFALASDKRAALDLALDHLLSHAPRTVPDNATAQHSSAPAPAIPLPAAGSPFGAVAVDTSSCTMCLSCVSACPAGALKDHADLLQLQFIEKNCVQCGLCEQTCPESAIQLVPRLLLSPQRKEPQALNTAKMFHCIRCAKPFGTEMAIQNMFTKLAGHSMFQGAAAQRLKMCMDCRVIDLHGAQDEMKIA